MSWRDAPLYVEAHDLARWLLERTRSWPSPGGEQLARAVGEAALELLTTVALALTFPATRGEHLEAADHAVVRLRAALRLSCELGLLSPGGLRFACGRLQAVGRMIGGWRKRLRPTAPPGGQRLPGGLEEGNGPPAARTV